MEYLNSNAFAQKERANLSPSPFETAAKAPSDNDSMIQDQVRTMLQMESKYNSSYLVKRKGFVGSAEREQHCEWRGKICEWCYRVIDHYQYDREVVSIAMDYFDRFLFKQDHLKFGQFTEGNSSSTPSQNYQLAAMTSLYLAIKLHAEVGVDSCEFNFLPNDQALQCDYVQPYHKAVLRLQSYVKLSRGQFTEYDILRMEEQILFTLNWKVNPVTPMCFVSYMIRLIPYQQSIKEPQTEIVLHVLHELSRYLTELAICLPSINKVVKPVVGKDFSASTRAFSPSSIAYASILASMDLITLDAFPIKMRQGFVERVSEIAFEASSFSQDEHLFFNPTSEEIKELKNLIRSSFRPEDVLQGAAEGGEECMQHPITIAKISGFLNIDTERGHESKKTHSRCGTPTNRAIDINRQDNGRSPTCVSRVARLGSHSKKFFRFSK